jgi:hypothetical protein
MLYDVLYIKAARKATKVKKGTPAGHVAMVYPAGHIFTARELSPPFKIWSAVELTDAEVGDLRHGFARVDYLGGRGIASKVAATKKAREADDDIAPKPKAPAKNKARTRKRKAVK